MHACMLQAIQVICLQYLDVQCMLSLCVLLVALTERTQCGDNSVAAFINTLHLGCNSYIIGIQRNIRKDVFSPTLDFLSVLLEVLFYSNDVCIFLKFLLNNFFHQVHTYGFSTLACRYLWPG